MSRKSNLFKSHFVTLQQDDTRVIDYNELIEAKIAALSQNIQESMNEEDFDEFAEGFTDGLDAVQVSALLDEESGNVIKAEPTYDGPSPEELIAQAQEQIDAMYANANAEVESIKQSAYQEASAQGYNDGAMNAAAELNAEKNRLQQEYAQKEAQLTEVFQKKIEEIEPELVDVLTDIYEHIIDVKLSDNRDLILHLISNALQKTDSSSEYLIHVSSDDFPFVSMQKESLLESAGIVNASVELIEDITVKKNECIIETDGGIFDCSLGVELKELKKQLLLLSYDGVKRG